MLKTPKSIALVGFLLVAGILIIVKTNVVTKIFPSSEEKDAQVTNNEVKTDDSTNETPEQPTGKKMAFSQFIKQDFGPYKCEVKQAFSDMENNGTVYLNAGNIRGDFSTIAEGRKMDSSFIMKDGYTYNWSSFAPTMGVKVKVNTTTDGDTNTQTSGTYSWNAEQIGEYNCEAWTVDESKFTLPSTITFTEIKS
jgi:hypothetical protein